MHLTALPFDSRAEGKDYHTLEERIEVEGLSRRGRLMAGLLATLGS